MYRYLPLVAALVLGCVLPCHRALAFDFDDVAKRARALAAAPYRAPEITAPKVLQDLDYDEYRAIQFKPERARWHGARLPFELTFVHLGRQYREPVKINEITADGVSEIKFNPADFDYGPNVIDPKVLAGIGFAGLRIQYSPNGSARKDEVMSFLGASYFRALGKGQRYGLSARGLAIDTAAMSGEEFPRFVEFWVERPAPDAKALVLYALLDSKSMTGAYRFVLRPGRDTATDVSARLFPREQGHKIGMAPLTSMYFYGENQGSARNDYRPEVHDSDGLSIHSATGEWIWRPLQNPKRLLVTSFMLTDPKGFGLMQRDRAFSSYEDLDHRYDLHPSAWVEPRGRWGKGRVELVQIPTPDATNENIVAYWVPADPLPKPQQAYDFEYRITWQKASPSRPPLAWVVQTRRGEGRDAAGKADNTIVFVIDFTKTTLPSRPEQSPPDGIVSLDGNGELLGSIVRRNDVTGGWRLTLRIRQTDVKKPVEARAVLRYKNTTVSETWSYILPPG